MLLDEKLQQAAYELADEIREGKWEHIKNLHGKPIPECDEIMNELKRRASDYSAIEYQ